VTDRLAPDSCDVVVPRGRQPTLLHVFPSFAVGGAQVRFAALANRFGPRWRHAIVALDGDTGCAERLRPEVPFTLIAPRSRRGSRLPAALLSVRRQLNELRPNVLVTSNWGSIEWALANLAPPRLPHLHTEDGFGPEEAAGQIWRRVATRRLALRWSTVVLPSHRLLDAARHVWRLPDRQLRYVPNGLDLQRFRPAAPPAWNRPAGEPPLIGTVAALRPEKNLGRLLRACALLRGQGIEFRLAVIGDGPERAALQRLAGELDLGDRVRFEGHVPDPAAAYRAMDLFALSSDTEQMPFSALEAMASGLPIAATNVGDLPTMVGAENQLFLTSLDAAALAAALRSLLADPALRSRIGAANRRKAERDYDQETMFQAYAALLDDAATA